MKNVIAVILILMLAGPGFAKKEAPAYDQIGTVFAEVFKTDVSANVTVNGKPYYAGCNVNDGHASCSDTPGVLMVKFSDGSTTIRPNRAFDFDRNEYVPNPTPIVPDATFKYRVTHIKPRNHMAGVPSEGDFICTPYTNIKGKTGEACYSI